MKKIFLFCFLLATCQLSAQVLEVPTLKSKAISGQARVIEWYQHEFIAEKGLSYVKKEVETYDEQGRLVSVLTENLKNNQSYKTTYVLNKKGLLQQMQIVNPGNNLALQTTDYAYKKGLLVKTTQIQGPNSVVKNYSYDNQKRLTGVEVLQNGSLSLTEYYELDDEGRRVRISRKLPADAAPKVTSTFTYTSKDGKLTTIENRQTNQGEYKITKLQDEATKRDESEHTQKLGTDQQGTNRQLFVDDAYGNWIKGEVLDQQYSRSRLVLRRITYANDSVTGRDKLLFPDDYQAQYYRKYSQKQVAVNGKIYTGGTAYNLEYTSDRLCYVSELKAWLLLKKYDDNSNMTQWAEAEVIAGGKEDVLWTASSQGIDIFNVGRKLVEGTSQSGYSAHELGGSVTAYVRGDTHKSFVAENAATHAGKVFMADLSDDDHYWGKVSDTTYVLTGYGKSVGLQKQFEDRVGNKLAMRKNGTVYYWYGLPQFREHFDKGEVGQIFKAVALHEPLKAIREEKVIDVDLSGFSYDKLKDGRYRLLSKDGQRVTGITPQTAKTPDDELITYFPLTNQYLLMEDYYRLAQDKEWPNQKVRVIADSSAYAYYIYNEGKSIVFYQHGVRVEKQKFSSHKLGKAKRMYGALLYDSTSHVNYGMTYDLSVGNGAGPMHKLPANSKGAYLLKLEEGRWVIFEKGYKVDNYDFSKLRGDGEIIHFYKDDQGRTGAYSFREFDIAKPGDFIYANNLGDGEVGELLKELGVDPGLKKD
ncbi:MAG: hypothetical protein Roseis2KO_23290 [Roseivirga sp.]